MRLVQRRVVLFPVLFTAAVLTRSAVAQSGGANQSTPPPLPQSAQGVDCSRIPELGIDRQSNLRAAQIRIACGIEPPGKPGALSAGPEVPTAAPANVNSVTGTETYPKVTQSESTVWSSSNGSAIVINYNDSSASPGNYSGVSRSTDGGVTFTRLLPSPFATGHGTNYGDPILVYNAKLGTWFAGDLVSGCGGQGIGLWTSLDGLTWSVGACAHNGTFDDRESMWVDNTPSSTFYGRMYVSWNDFATAGDSIFVTHSDDGVVWTSPVQLTSGFIRNVQITGGQDGRVFVAGMNEGGGGFNARTNLIYRSINGGDTWAQISMGASFAAPGDSLCPSNGYFARISPIWRHMGWGQPGVGPGGAVHYAYAGKGVNTGDTGDIYYTRSTDNGSTWSAPIVLNTDRAAGGIMTQWMPSLSVTANGGVHVYWYDRRNTTDGQNYEIWGRQSADNGATWLTDEPVSTVLIPQPEQPDPNVQSCYAGDYNYATALGNMHYATWTDGRVAVDGHFQQDVFFAAVLAAPPPGPDFSVSLNPTSLTILQGGTGTSTTTVTSTGGFSSAVTLACSGQPAGVTCAFAPTAVTPPPNGSITSTLTVTVNASVPAGNYSFFAQGTSGSLTRTATLNLQVTALAGGDFSLSCSPSNFNIGPNFTKTSKCTVQSLNGFNSSVTMSCSGQPSGVACNFAPGTVTPPSNGTVGVTLTLTGSSAPLGQWVFRVVGISGTQKTTDIRLRIR